MNNKRVSRISEEIKKVISQLLYQGIKDPRISSMTSITRVEVTRDLSFANIYISVLGNQDNKSNSILGLESAKGFIKKEIGKQLDLRHVPELRFHLDESIEHAIHMSELIKEVNKNGKNEI